MTVPLDEIVSRALEGDREALDALVLELGRPVYNLALRMLWHPADAEDATQEILLKLVTHLGTFRRESSVRTWALRVAAHHLMRVRRSRVEAEELTFGAFARDLAEGLADPQAPAAAGPDQGLLEEEVKIGCTHAMLLCLDREHRLAYILGDVFELSGDEGAEVLDVTPAAFRKRLSRARERVRAFMREQCGLVSAAAACRCSKRIGRAVETGRVNPAHLLFAGRGTRPHVEPQVHEMEELHRIAAIFRGHPEYEPSEHLPDMIRRLLESRKYSVME